MDNTNLSKITMVIPTFNRCSFILRILNYYQQNAPCIRILIADSSSDENQAINKRTISSLSNPNISHFSYPVDIHGITKLLDVMNHVDTRYCVCCADDDFITPQGIVKSVDCLENNQDFTIAHGHYISFWTEDDKFYWEPCSPYESNTSPEPANRFLFHFANYQGLTFYAVHRTDFLKMIFEETEKFTTDTVFAELLPSMLAAVHGKIMHTGVFYSARTRHFARLGRPHFNEYIRDGIFNEMYDKFKECLSSHLSEQSGTSIENAAKIVDNGTHLYYNVNFKMKEKDIQSLSLYEKLFLPGKKSMEEFANCLESPSSDHYADFNIIRDHVLAHPKIIHEATRIHCDEGSVIL